MAAQGQRSERKLRSSTTRYVLGRRVQGRQDPPLKYFNTHLGDLDTPRQLVEYAGATAAAETVHIVSEDENYRLLGAQGFIFFPTLAWQVSPCWDV